MICDDIKNLNGQQTDTGKIDILDGSRRCITFFIARSKKREVEERGENESLVLDYLQLVLELCP